MSNENPKLTVTLTGRAPVTITKADWPVIASADGHDGREHECQANRRWWLKVRQHEDGRAIVYGVYTSQYQGARDKRGGELLDTNAPGTGELPDIAAAILRVAATVDAEDIADECIADLPATDLV